MGDWRKGDRVEVYDFDDDNWREAIVLQPEWNIDGYPYMQVRYTTSSDADDFASTLFIAPELVERHVRPA
jgi:hypothetical protein